MTDPLYPLEIAMFGADETRGIPVDAERCFVTDTFEIRKYLCGADARDWPREF